MPGSVKLRVSEFEESILIKPVAKLLVENYCYMQMPIPISRYTFSDETFVVTI